MEADIYESHVLKEESVEVLPSGLPAELLLELSEDPVQLALLQPSGPQLVQEFGSAQQNHESGNLCSTR